MPIEIAIGRWLAVCAHPVRAWRIAPRSVQAVIVGTYFGMAYVAVLSALLIARP
jgi:hypothetical protein